MIRSVRFENFRVLKDAILPLSPLTLIVGPNGSGKTTAIEAIARLRSYQGSPLGAVASAGYLPRPNTRVSVEIEWAAPYEVCKTYTRWRHTSAGAFELLDPSGNAIPNEGTQPLLSILGGARLYALDANHIAQPVAIQPADELDKNGGRLAGVLDCLHSQHPEEFSALNAELRRWMPEYDQVLLETSQPGMKSILLRTSAGNHRIPARDLSQGTLLALALLTLAHLPSPPTILCLEEPDRGIHPRLLREVFDALVRLAYPEKSGQKRAPVQVIATTHSPDFLQCFHDSPRNVVIAEKDDLFARFECLGDRKDLDEIIGSSNLGEVWFSGILGGVPTGPR